jgi:hypothetical protein
LYFLQLTRALGAVDHFGFPWQVCLSLPKHPLTTVGFPWNLSSELSLFNGLQGKIPENFFLTLFPQDFPQIALTSRAQAAEGQNYPSGKLRTISDFMQSSSAATASRTQIPRHRAPSQHGANR